MNRNKIRERVLKLLDIEDPVELEETAKLIEQVAQARHSDAVRTQLAARRNIRIAGIWVFSRVGEWHRYHSMTGDVVARVVRDDGCWRVGDNTFGTLQKAKEAADATLSSSGWELG